MSMVFDTFVGRQAEITITDPWEFMTELGTEPLTGHVVASEDDGERVNRLEIRLDRPIQFGGRQLQRVSAEPRYVERPTIVELRQGERVPASFEAAEEEIDPGRRGSASSRQRPLGLLGGLRIV